MATPADHLLFKVVMVGNSGAGKSAITDRFTKNEFDEAFNPTSITFASKIIQIEDKRIKFQVWDTSGQDKHRKAIRTYHREADAIILVLGFQRLNVQSPVVGETIDEFKKRAESEIDTWFTEIKNYKPSDAVVFMVLNQADVFIEKLSSEDSRAAMQQALLEYAKRKAKELVMTGLQEPLFLVSAKNSNGVNELFGKVGIVLLEKAGVALPLKPSIYYDVKDASAVVPGQAKQQFSKGKSFFNTNHLLILMLIMVITAAVMLCVIYPPVGLAAMIPTVAAAVGLGGVSTAVLALMAGAATLAMCSMVYGLFYFAFGGKTVKTKSVTQSAKTSEDQDELLPKGTSTSATAASHPTAAQVIGPPAAYQPIIVPPATAFADQQPPSSGQAPVFAYGSNE